MAAAEPPLGRGAHHYLVDHGGCGMSGERERDVGRRVHDALLRVLTSAERRRALSRQGDGAPGAGVDAVLSQADPERLGRLARFMARHFYRERIVRLFAASRALARQRGVDPLAVLDTPAFDAVLASAELGSLATAERVAGLVEQRLEAPLSALAYGRDLLIYEGALFRAEAGARRWRETTADAAVPVASPHARVCALDWDVTRLVIAVRRGERELPEPTRAPTRLLVALGKSGRVTTVRCPEGVERILGALDGARTPADVARVAGLSEPDADQALRQLTEIGAVEWRSATGEASPGHRRPH
jgi:hypothetical protein